MTTRNQITLENGTEVPKGTEISWSKGHASFILNGKKTHIPVQDAVTALGIAHPDDDELEEWVYDSMGESVLGYPVEHDGYDPEGSPSWFLVLGLI